MQKAMLVLALGLMAAVAVASKEAHPLIGDPVHGEALYRKATGGDSVKVGGDWLNAFDERQALAALKQGKLGFPRVKSENILDLYDVLAFLQTRNTNITDLIPEADHVLIAEPELDEHAVERLRERGGITPGKDDEKRRIFAFYKLGEGGTKQGLRRVFMKDFKARDALKPKKKVGYVVFLRLKGLRDGKHEAAIAVSPDIVIRDVVIRAPDGSLPADLNRAAKRFIGQGARGKYDPLRPGGAGKAVLELAKPLSEAFLLGMESVYMFEVEEREYFAFDAE